LTTWVINNGLRQLIIRNYSNMLIIFSMTPVNSIPCKINL
jgi:hypothetical protein